jgi:hypothetical protein
MNIPSRRFVIRAAAGLALALAACIQGPWDYYPENPPTFKGVFATGYVLAKRPLTQVCFERILSLDEEHTQAFAWYDSADVRVSGPFSGQSRTVVLSPDSVTPNCFKGDPSLLAEHASDYTLEARFAWDSAGTRVLSHITGTAHVPDSFSMHDSAAAPRLARTGGIPDDILNPAFLNNLPPEVKAPFNAQYGDSLSKFRNDNDTAGMRRYLGQNGKAMRDLIIGLLKRDQTFYHEGDTLFYLNGALNTLSHTFSSRHSADVGAVLITQRFDSSSERPETSFDRPLGLKPDSDRYYFPGNIRRLIIYPNAVGPHGWNALDSMGVVNTWFLTGRNRLYFYGFEKAYYDFHASATQVQGGGGPSDGDPRVKPRYNVEGGEGIFVGAVADSFDVVIKHDDFTTVYPLPIVHVLVCRKDGWGDSRDCREFYPLYCRDQKWQPGDCRIDAVRLCLDTAAAKDASIGTLCDSIGNPARADTLTAQWAAILHCVEKDFPDDSVCAPSRSACLESKGVNLCKTTLWDYCKDNNWKPDACGPGIASYCHDKPRLSETLCRHADLWCAAHADSPLCK